MIPQTGLKIFMTPQIRPIMGDTSNTDHSLKGLSIFDSTYTLFLV